VKVHNVTVKSMLIIAIDFAETTVPEFVPHHHGTRGGTKFGHCDRELNLFSRGKDIC
jgi:hypothetical protein